MRVVARNGGWRATLAISKIKSDELALRLNFSHVVGAVDTE